MFSRVGKMTFSRPVINQSACAIYFCHIIIYNIVQIHVAIALNRFTIVNCKTILFVFTLEHNLGSNESCRYTVSLASLGFHSFSLLFDNLTIPPGEKLLIRKTTRLYLQPYGEAVKVFTHANNGRLHYIEPHRMEALALEFNSTTQFKIRFQDYNRGTIFRFMR